MKYARYHKYKNPDPSTDKEAAITTAQLLQIIEQKISDDARRIYHTRNPNSILEQDLRFAVIRELSYRLSKEILEIDRFEKQNSNDLRNYPWGGMDNVEEVKSQ
jgi:hypothetical protein